MRRLGLGLGLNGGNGNGAGAAAQTFSQSLRALATFPVIWSLDDESMRTVTGRDVDSLKETGGDTRFDLAYVSGTKPTVETRDGITVAADNEATTVFQAGATGTLANLWASGKGTLYIAAYFNQTPLGDRSLLRSGDGASYGLDVYVGSNATADRYPRGYIWDGGAARQTAAVAVGEGWHQLCFKCEQNKITMYCDGTELGNVTFTGVIGYLDGRMRIFHGGPDCEVAVIAMSADNAAHNDTLRGSIEAKLRQLIAALP